MNPDDVIEILDQLGQRLTPYGEKAWELLVRQMVIEGVVTAIGLVFLIVITTISGVIAYRVYRTWSVWKPANDYQYHKNPSEGKMMVTTFIFAAIALTVALILPVLVTNLLTKLANPEYAALEKAIDLVQGANPLN